MARIIETTVYTFDELSEKAKEKARDQYRVNHEFYPDYAIEDAVEFAGFLGITISENDGHKCIYWSVSGSQGDGACFEGTWSADQLNVNSLKAYAPKDNKLHKVADCFAAIARKYPTASFTVKQRGHYYHSGCTEFNCDPGECPETVLDNLGEEFPEDDPGECADRAQETWGEEFPEEDLIQAARDFMDWIYSQLESEYEYQQSDDWIDDVLVSVEHEFTKDGELF